MRDDKSEYMILKNRAFIGADDGTYEWAVKEIDRLREALEAAHYYIDASDFELKLEGITRDDTLRKARELREAVWVWKHRAALGEGKE